MKKKSVREIKANVFNTNFDWYPSWSNPIGNGIILGKHYKRSQIDLNQLYPRLEAVGESLNLNPELTFLL